MHGGQKAKITWQERLREEFDDTVTTLPELMVENTRVVINPNDDLVEGIQVQVRTSQEPKLNPVPATSAASATPTVAAKGFQITMSVRWSTAFAFLIIGPFALAVSWHDDSHYVPLGPRTGYYIVRPGSALSHQLGVDVAPTIDTADPFRHGYGADALAFRFNRAGILSGPPAYVVQGTPNEFYTRRLGSFIRGRTSSHDVEAFFGRPQSTQARSDGVITYYAIQVYNPFQDRSGGRGR